MSRADFYKEDFWMRWFHSDTTTREEMIRMLILRSILHREISPDLIAYIVNTYLEDLAEFICEKICENKCLIKDESERRD
ncbi:MAG: hypothetical protein QXJ51_03880 [Sulfolobales archaeon]